MEPAGGKRPAVVPVAETDAARLMRLLDYALPGELIAQHPAARREDARLLVVDRASGALTDSGFAEVGGWLRPGDSLVVNETRVRPARLMVRRASGGRVELLFVRPAAAAGAGECWQVLAKPAKHAVPGARLATADGALVVEVIGAGEQGERTVRIAEGSLDAVLRAQGEVPLPPYIHRPPSPEDAQRYQTVYARVDGAVAAPTAGLHFSAALLGSLEAAGIRRVPVTLHVGPGTFRPIVAEDPREHRMEEEWFEVGEVAAAELRATRERGGRIVAVGTTTVRALESMADACGGGIGAAGGWTRKYIVPPHEFRAVDALITNFHLPRTTLLLLVAAFAGEGLLREAYAHAVRERYRFYSYGDAMVIV
jgi:S-adenosylmethionine:tRNA ribosyltransferase-isomerase